MKQIEVVAAIIHDEGRIFATQRGYGDYKDGWEFPGGKMEPGESPEFHLKMHCFWCHIESGQLVLKEHEAARWLKPEDLDSVDWLPADKVVVKKLQGCFYKRPC